MNKWIEHNTVLIRQSFKKFKEPDFLYYSKILCCDLDFTLMKPKNPTKKLYNPRQEWQLLDKKVMFKLNKFHKDKYSIVICSNQNGIAKGKLTRDDLQKRFDDFYKNLSDKNIPILAIFALEKNNFRKPHTGMMKLLDELYMRTGHGKISHKDSLFIGDAAGRKPTMHKRVKEKADFSHVDRAFAFNTCLNFLTPDEFFLKSRKRPWVFPNTLLMMEEKKKQMELGKILKKEEPFNGGVYNYFLDNFPQVKQFFIILVGYPTSGKTQMANYIKSNTDEYVKSGRIASWMITDAGGRSVRAFKKHAKFISEEMIAGNSIIVDDTNETAEKREKLINLVKCYRNIGVIVLEMDTTKKNGNASWQYEM